MGEDEKVDETQEQPLPEDGGETAARTGPDWEKRDQLGFVGGLTGTIKSVMLEPTATFEEMKLEGGIGTPLTFALIMAVIGSIGGIVWNAITAGPEALIFVAVLVPIGGLIMPFIWAGIIHVMMMILGGAERSYEVTYRTVCYAAAPNVLGVIPFVGIIGGIWGIVCTIVGLTRTQNCSTGKAVMAVLIPMLVLMCLCIGLIVLAVVAGVGMAAAASQAPPPPM